LFGSHGAVDRAACRRDAVKNGICRSVTIGRERVPAVQRR
jgi:hypothetical protein